MGDTDSAIKNNADKMEDIDSGIENNAELNETPSIENHESSFCITEIKGMERAFRKNIATIKKETNIKQKERKKERLGENLHILPFFYIFYPSSPSFPTSPTA